MNPKDEVKFEDIKKLVNASLEKFYKNDRDLIEMSNEEDMISEQCMVFHIGSYMKNKMNNRITSLPAPFTPINPVIQSSWIEKLTFFSSKFLYVFFNPDTSKIAAISYTSSYRISIIAFNSSLVIPIDFAVCIISCIFCSTRRRLVSRNSSILLVDTKVPFPT